MDRCPRCAEPLAAGAAWCGLCLRRVLDIEPAELAMELRGTERTGWTRPERHWEQPPPARYSRTEPGPLSFGPITKTLMSVAVLALIPVLRAVAGFADVYQLVATIPTVVLAVLALAAIWAKRRVV